MKQIKTIDELLNLIRSTQQNGIYHEINGKKYKFDVVRVLQIPLGDLMQDVRDGLLYYDMSA
jgi:hypothetical protein